MPFSNVHLAYKANYAMDPSDLDRYRKDLAYAPIPGDSSPWTAANMLGLLAPGTSVFLRPNPGETGLQHIQHVASAAGQQALNAGKGILGLEAAPKTSGEKHAALMGPQGLALYRMGRGVVDNETIAGPQTARYWREANATPWNEPALKMLEYGRAGTNALSMLNPLDPGGTAPLNATIDSGDMSDAQGAGLFNVATLAAPEVLRAAPGIMVDALERGGSRLQTSGAGRMERFLNNGKPLPPGSAGPVYGNPGKAVLDLGPEVSVASSPHEMFYKLAPQLDEARAQVDAAANGSPALVSVPHIREVVGKVIEPLRKDASSVGGSADRAARLSEIAKSFDTALGDRTSLTVPETVDHLRTLKNNLGLEVPGSPAHRVMGDIRNGLKELLYKAAPEMQEPLEHHESLSDANTLLQAHSGSSGINYGLGGIGADAAVGATTLATTHSPELAGLAALGRNLLPWLSEKPFVQTGLASNLYRLGRGLGKIAPVIESAGPVTGAAANPQTLGGAASRILAPPPLTMPITVALPPPAQKRTAGPSETSSQDGGSGGNSGQHDKGAGLLNREMKLLAGKLPPPKKRR